MATAQAGNVAREMAAAPLPATPAVDTAATVKPTATIKAGIAGLLMLLGKLSIIAGDGRKYPRTQGFGANKKPHPDGGTNETIAFVEFRPFAAAGVSAPLIARVYCERFVKDGQPKRQYSVSVPFIKPERGDAGSRDGLELLKGHIRDKFQEWQKSDTAKAATARVSTRADVWEEADEAPAPTA